MKIHLLIQRVEKMGTLHDPSSKDSSDLELNSTADLDIRSQRN